MLAGLSCMRHAVANLVGSGFGAAAAARAPDYGQPYAVPPVAQNAADA